MNFEFATAARIIFGAGKLKEIGGIAAGFGRKALIVVGAQTARAQGLLDQLSAQAIEFTVLNVAGEPTIELAQQGVTLARDSGCDMVISYGGGSAIDAGKAIAALVTNLGEPLDYLEVIGAGQALERAPLPFVAIPTTAGTGSEVTRNAVLKSNQQQVKVSLRSPMMLPKVALVDPDLLAGLSPAVAAATGMDALTQVIEPYVCNRANPITDALCREAIPRAARSLRKMVESPDAHSRADMALVSLFGGLALANSGLGAVHGFAAPIGGMFPAPHGAVCAQLLPQVWQANVQALRARQPDSPILARYDEVARMLSGNLQANADDGARWLYDLRAALQIPAFSAYGMAVSDVPVLVEKSAAASSMQANPIKLTVEELTKILATAL